MQAQLAFPRLLSLIPLPKQLPALTLAEQRELRDRLARVSSEAGKQMFKISDQALDTFALKQISAVLKNALQSNRRFDDPQGQIKPRGLVINC